MITSILVPPADYKPERVLREITLAHPLVQERWPKAKALLAAAGFDALYVNETYRYNVRQQWLFGSGRTEDQVIRWGIPRRFARPHEPIVTNASSCLTSAHGWTRRREDGIVVPAAAALDVVPLGPDGKPWTKDDPWDAWMKVMDTLEDATGLRHFRKPGKPVWDRPHLQLTEWSDTTHSLTVK